MCRQNQHCDEDKAARSIAGLVEMSLGRRDAQNVAYILAEARAAGVRVRTVEDVIRHALRKAAYYYADQAAFALTEGGRQ